MLSQRFDVRLLGRQTMFDIWYICMYVLEIATPSMELMTIFYSGKISAFHEVFVAKVCSWKEFQAARVIYSKNVRIYQLF